MVRDVLELLMGELQADIHIPDWRNRFALHHAAVDGHIENVVFLLQNRNCLNSKSRVIAECCVFIVGLLIAPSLYNQMT